ncbi:MAG: hypothetical protein KBA81_04885 [Rhabdochlamydiaceae bacterium]|nr:hypothetical protein [Rhabdochlamydiaceae bacterium]
MHLKAISEPIQKLYQSIPGETTYKKTAFLGEKALQTLPFVAAGYLLRNRASTGMVIQCMEAMPEVGQMLENPLLSRTLFSCGIGIQIQQSIHNAKIFRNASSPTDHLMYFCMAYSAAYYAAGYFNSLFPTKETVSEANEPAAKSIDSQVLDYLLKASSLYFQFKYRPLITLAGLGLGAFFAKNDFSHVVRSLVASQPDFIKNPLEALANMLSEFSNTPPPETGKVTKIWNGWNRMILSVASSPYAFSSSLMQGKELVF